MILAGLGQAVPAVRRLNVSPRRRLWALLAAGLPSHVLLDAGNSYGVLGPSTGGRRPVL